MRKRSKTSKYTNDLLAEGESATYADIIEEICNLIKITTK